MAFEPVGAPMIKHLLIPLIGVVGVSVVVTDFFARLRAEDRVVLAPRPRLPADPSPDGLPLRPGLRRLARAVDEFEARHGRRPASREELSAEFEDADGVWNCPNCGNPYLLGTGWNVSGEPRSWPFEPLPPRGEGARIAACCGSCRYDDGTTEVLTFDGRLACMAFDEAMLQVRPPRPNCARR